MDTSKTQKNIIIYSTPACVHCHHLKDYLTEKGFTYQDIDVTKSLTAMQEALLKSGQQGVPVTDIEGKIIVGFDQEKVDEILGITN